jgi:hypothetical protein
VLLAAVPSAVNPVRVANGTDIVPADHLGMTPPRCARKVLLVPAGMSAIAGQPPVRRYRVARLRLDTPEASATKRFDYLKRTFD